MHGLKVHHFINNTTPLDILHAALIYDCLGAFFPPPTTPLKETESFSVLLYSFTSRLFCYSPEIGRFRSPGWISSKVTGQFALTTEINPLRLVKAAVSICKNDRANRIAAASYHTKAKSNGSSLRVTSRRYPGRRRRTGPAHTILLWTPSQPLATCSAQISSARVSLHVTALDMVFFCL